MKFIIEQIIIFSKTKIIYIFKQNKKNAIKF